MSKVIMELGELSELYQKWKDCTVNLEWYQNEKWKLDKELDKLRTEIEELKHGSGKWIVFTPDAIDHEHAKFGSFQEAKKRAVEISEKTGLVTQIAEVKETITKGEEF